MKRIYVIISAIACILASCTQHDHFLSDNQEVNSDFSRRVEGFAQPEYFNIFNDSAKMSGDELRAMKWLYAYMPLPDIVDYSGEYFLSNVKSALKAREEMPWGKSVPEREFLHFVLPIRVNNEDLDNHREIFYTELKDRVKDLTMAEAILEINHWCHEKVTYEPSDSRTHSPLASVSSAIGRCGEESTFTVAALRTMGIPARQVYTPRWAHTDDNHAWVEAWADGEWHFLGACEPEAVLDLGWFNDPASRGMLMNTRTPGRYDGPEEKLLQTQDYTDINVTKKYADVDTIKVTVVDNEGRAIEGAKVDFRLYNYAEFFPIASKTTKADGKASLVAGLGDLLVWASKDGSYTTRKVSVGKDHDITLTLDPKEQKRGAESYDIVPPPVKTAKVIVPEELAAENSRRKAYEDSVRMAYVATFADDSRGNHAIIQEFLSGLDNDRQPYGEAMLDALTKKDLTDVTLEVLNDAMQIEMSDDPMFVQYVLSPRIANEFLVPFREKFATVFTAEQKAQYRNSPELWVKWVTDSIATDQSWQPSSVRMSPWSTLQLRHTDEASRDIFFVASSRAMGIPSRVEEVSGQAQYYTGGEWINAFASTNEDKKSQKGILTLKYDKCGRIDDPNYYTHFTLSKIENGRPVLLNYPEEATWKNTFANSTKVDAGEYLLVTGQRMSDGSVLAHTEIFTVPEGGRVSIPLILRQDSEGVKVIGDFNSENLYTDPVDGVNKSLLSATGRGYYILGIVSALDEPSNHVLRDIIAKKDEIFSTGRPIVLLFPSQEDLCKSALIDQLRDIAIIGIDTTGAIQQELIDNMRLGNNLPILIIADTFNRVVYASEGYTIGVGQTLLDTMSKL